MKNIKKASTIGVAGQQPKDVLSVNKWKFIIWLFIVSIVMIFASQTSAYLVRRAEGNWTEFEIPTIFWFSTAVLFFSSLTMHFSLVSAKKGNQNNLKTFVGITFVLGVLFLVMQVMGWNELQNQGVYLKGNPSGSFLYILTGLHGFHIILGLGILIGTLVMAYKKEITPQNTILAEVCAISWHFLDVLWIYLFIFLLYFR